MSYFPNTFQTPNAIVDRLMHLLTDSELRVLLYAIRHTLGWKKKAQSYQAHISLSNFVNGFEYVDAEDQAHHYDGCGLGRGAVSKALKELCKYRILKKVGTADQRGQLWELAFMTDENVDEIGLKLRKENKSTKNKKRTAKARVAAEEKKQVSVTQTTDRGSVAQTGVVSTTDQGGLSDRHNETHRETHRETQDSTDKPSAQVDGTVKPRKRSKKQLENDALVESLGKAMGVEATSADYSNYARVARTLRDAGIPMEDFAEYIALVNKAADREGWTVTINSLLNNGRPGKYVQWRDNKKADEAHRAAKQRQAEQQNVTVMNEILELA